MTIEDRAMDYLRGNIESPARRARYDAYIDGAEDQKEIDIEKACQWLEDALNGNNIEGCKDGEKLINDFRKAMEDRA